MDVVEYEKLEDSETQAKKESFLKYRPLKKKDLNQNTGVEGAGLAKIQKKGCQTNGDAYLIPRDMDKGRYVWSEERIQRAPSTNGGKKMGFIGLSNKTPVPQGALSSYTRSPKKTQCPSTSHKEDNFIGFNEDEPLFPEYMPRGKYSGGKLLRALKRGKQRKKYLESDVFNLYDAQMNDGYDGI